MLSHLTPRIDITAIVLIDATIAPPGKDSDFLTNVLTQVVWVKPDVWRSRKDALKSLSASPGFKTWDPRVLELFVVRASDLFLSVYNLV